MPDRQIIFDLILLVESIISLGVSDFFSINPNSDVFLIVGHPAIDVGKSFGEAFCSSLK